MNNLFIIIDESSNGYTINILNLISIISILTGVFVIITKNPIVSVLFLICLFLSIACYLILLGISYVGLSYLLVYIGAVSILFLFILMLINIRISELQSETTNSLAIALILGICFYFIIYNILPQQFFIKNLYNVYSILFNLINFTLGYSIFASSNIWEGLIIENLHITSIGNIMYTSHFILLIIISIILLQAMVGSIIITLKS